jgi:hypothetical protein
MCAKYVCQFPYQIHFSIQKGNQSYHRNIAPDPPDRAGSIPELICCLAFQEFDFCNMQLSDNNFTSVSCEKSALIKNHRFSLNTPVSSCGNSGHY